MNYINKNWQLITLDSISKVKASIKAKQSIHLQVSLYPENASNKAVKWLSEDDDIAVVNSSGLVTGKKAGTVNVICRSVNGKEASCTITVKKPEKIADTNQVQSNDTYSHTQAQDVYQPFYGIWCGAAKNRSEAEEGADMLRSKGFDAEVIITTDWSNLNKEKWYVVTAGVYRNKSDAKSALPAVQKAYPSAYVKYSGEYFNNYTREP